MSDKASLALDSDAYLLDHQEKLGENVLLKEENYALRRMIAELKAEA